MGSISAVFLAGVLLVAAVGKFRRPSRTAAGMADLGLPAVSVLAWAVPLSELTVAASLIVTPGWGGVLAFGLLAAFTVVLVTTLRSGRLVPCRCFGENDDAPVSRRHVVRNVWLLGHAAVAATTSTLSWPTLSEAIAAGAMLAVGPIAVAAVDPGSKVTP